jgi:hypothetical protein
LPCPSFTNSAIFQRDHNVEIRRQRVVSWIAAQDGYIHRHLLPFDSHLIPMLFHQAIFNAQQVEVAPGVRFGGIGWSLSLTFHLNHVCFVC